MIQPSVQLSLLHPFLSVRTTGELAAFLGIDVQSLNFYAYILSPSRRYRQFSIRKRSGGSRTISAPIKPLKNIQRVLATAIRDTYPTRPIAYGYVPGKSIIENAEIHKKQTWVLRVDLKDFFPSINFGRVRGALMAEPFLFPKGIATTIAALCTYENSLPQGAPTSPILSNVVAHMLDGKLLALAKKSHCRVTRYSDDLVFSTSHSMFSPRLVQKNSHADVANYQLGTELDALVREAGFVPNEEKTRLMHKTQRQTVTGLVTNEKVNINRSYIRELRAAIHLWEKYKIKLASQIFFEKYYKRNRIVTENEQTFAEVIRGRLQYIGKVKGWDDSVYLGLAKKLAAQDPTFQLKTVEPFAPALSRVRLFAEGATDYMYLEAALKSPVAVEKKWLERIQLEKTAGGRGDTELLKTLQIHSRTPHAEPHVFMFDRDNETVLKDVEMPGVSYKNWGNNVFSFAIPVPDHREKEGRICIEHYFKDEQITTEDENGFRLFLRSEFDDNGIHIGGQLFTRDLNKKTLIIDDNIFSVNKKVNVALQKRKFADCVIKGDPPFQNFSWDSFFLIFEVVDQILLRRDAV